MRFRSSGLFVCSPICSGSKSAKARSSRCWPTAKKPSPSRPAASAPRFLPAPFWPRTRPARVSASETGGPGCSIMAMLAALSLIVTAARSWCRNSSATAARTSGYPIGAQMGWAKRDHQFCLAHLIRDAKYAIDAGDTTFAPRFHELLQRACGIAGRRPNLADSTLRNYARKLDADLDALLRIKPSHAEGKKFQATIKACRQHLFVFMKNRAIPPTNNGSEQAIRPCVTFRKVTNCFRSEWGAKLYANIRSVLETARRRTIGALQAVRLTLDDKPLLNTG